MQELLLHILFVPMLVVQYVYLYQAATTTHSYQTERPPRPCKS